MFIVGGPAINEINPATAGLLAGIPFARDRDVEATAPIMVLEARRTSLLTRPWPGRGDGANFGRRRGLLPRSGVDGLQHFGARATDPHVAGQRIRAGNVEAGELVATKNESAPLAPGRSVAEAHELANTSDNWALRGRVLCAKVG